MRRVMPGDTGDIFKLTGLGKDKARSQFRANYALDLWLSQIKDMAPLGLRVHSRGIRWVSR